MATVTKDFRLKSGLVVEGSNATVNGSDVITANSIVNGNHSGVVATYDSNAKTIGLSVDVFNLNIDTQGPLTYTNNVLDLSTGYGLQVGTGNDLMLNVSDFADDLAGIGLNFNPNSLALDVDYTEVANIAYVDALGSSQNLANTVVKRDGNGNFEAGQITAGQVFSTDIALGYYGSLTMDPNTFALSLLGNAGPVNITGFGVDINSNAGDITIDSLEGAVILSGVNGAYIGSTSIPGNEIATKDYADSAYTDADARAAISGGDGINYSASTGVIAAAAATLGGVAVSGSGLAVDRLIVDTWYDANGAAATAEQNANDYTDAAVGAIPSAILSVAGDTGTDSVTLDGDTLTVSGGAGITTSVANDTITVDIDSTVATLTGTQTLTNKTLGSLGGAVSLGYSLDAGNFRIENLGSPLSGTDAANKNYVDTAVSSLVDGAPALLDTLNEIAAAINDDANYATTMTTALAGKQANLNAGAAISSADLANNIVSVVYADGLDRDGNGKLIVSAGWGITSNASGVSLDTSRFGSGLSVGPSTIDIDDTVVVTHTDLDGYLNSNNGTTYVALTDYADALVAAGDPTATPTYEAIDVNSVATQVASTVTAGGTGTDVAYAFDGTLFRTAKFLVKIASGTHTQVSEVLLTTDSSNNVAITEYAIVGTNGSLGDITAEYGVIDVITNGVKLIVTSATSGAEITVMGTLLV